MKDVGSTKILGLLESAVAQFPNSIVPRNQTERAEVFETIEDEADPIWDGLDIEFYEYEEDIYGLDRG